MSISQIFTGHALDLSDIRAVSDVMLERRTHTNGALMHRTMYLEITLAGGAVLRHNHFFMDTFVNHMDEEQKAGWKKAHDDLREKRKELLEQWSQATGKKLDIETNDEPETLS